MITFRITHEELPNQCIFNMFVPMPDESMLKAEKKKLISLGIYSRSMIWWIQSMFLKKKHIFLFLHLLTKLFLMQPRVPLAFLAPGAHCCFVHSLLSTRNQPQVLSHRAASQQVDPQLALVHGDAPPLCRTLHLPLLHSRQFCSVENRGFRRCRKLERKWHKAVSGKIRMSVKVEKGEI